MPIRRNLNSNARHKNRCAGRRYRVRRAIF
jgi:hypothetical protein